MRAEEVEGWWVEMEKLNSSRVSTAVCSHRTMMIDLSLRLHKFSDTLLIGHGDVHYLIDMSHCEAVRTTVSQSIAPSSAISISSTTHLSGASLLVP